MFNGQALGESLYALNHHLQTQYIRDDIYAGLNATPPCDFIMIANTVNHTSEITTDVTDSGFGPAIPKAPSLQTALAHFNTKELASNEDLYIQAARAETEKGLLFSAIATIKGHNETGRELLGFTHVLEQREARLAYAVPAVNSRSFDRYTLMFASLAY